MQLHVMHDVIFTLLFLEFSVMNDVEKKERLQALGRHIKSLRIKAGYTSHEDFANEHGFTMKQYWRLESGFDFKISTLLKLLDAHKVSYTDFFKDLNT